MNKLVFLAAATLAMVLVGPRAHAQSAPLRGELIRDWAEQKAIMLAIADAMPAEKFSYKTTPPQRDYGQQIMHVANGTMIYLQFMGAKTPPPAIARNASTKAEMLKAFSDVYDYGTTVLNEQTDQSLMETIQTNQYLGVSSRARVFYFLLGHTWDIYGQMAVYLRLNGITPPRSQRP